MQELGENDLAETMDRLLSSSASTISLNRRLMEKAIDVSWVEAIENGLNHVDNVVRNPGRTIMDVEEIVPIALSKKVTVAAHRSDPELRQKEGNDHPVQAAERVQGREPGDL